MARPFNHMGPARAPALWRPILHDRLQIELGRREPVIWLGNMAAQRDFSDVRDVAQAYLAMIKGADGGQVYNICSGVPRSIQSLLDVMLSQSAATFSRRPIRPNSARLTHPSATAMHPDCAGYGLATGNLV